MFSVDPFLADLAKESLDLIEWNNTTICLPEYTLLSGVCQAYLSKA